MKFLKILLISIIAILIIGVIVYVLGPVYPYEEFDATPIVTDTSIDQVESIIQDHEAQYKIKPDNEARVIWYDGVKKTEYGLLYLHGWSASQGEGAPIHTNLARQYGANLILTRQPEHGLIKEELLLDVTAKQQVDYVKSMIDLASKTCEKLIVFSVSTGSMYSAYLSSQDDRIYAQIMVAPNFKIADPLADILDQPWGLQIARKFLGSKYRSWQGPPGVEEYWYTRYRIEGLVVLDQIMSNYMDSDVFSRIDSPVYIGYYYENEEKKDQVIDTHMIDVFANEISTNPELIKVQTFKGDLEHVLTTPIMNKEYQTVEKSISEYLEQVLGLNVVLRDEFEQ